MNIKLERKINNTIVLSTITEITKATIKRLEGTAYATESEDLANDEILTKLIASRIKLKTNKLAK